MIKKGNYSAQTQATPAPLYQNLATKIQYKVAD